MIPPKDLFWDQLAIESYKYLLKRNKGQALIHNNMGLAYQRINRENKAIRAFEKAIKCDNTHIEAYYHLATLLKKQHKPKIALRYFKHYHNLLRRNLQQDIDELNNHNQDQA